MHKYNTITIGLIFSLFSFSAAAVKMQNNDFCINGSNWSYIGFDIESYAVTAGQPWGGIKKKNQPKQHNCIRIESGRQNSSKPFKWAVDNSVNSGNNFITANASFYPPTNAIYSNYPDSQGKANFAFFGTLVLVDSGNNMYSCPNVVMGQTGYQDIASHNVWFISSNYTANVLQCSSSGVATPIYLYLNSASINFLGSNNIFTITK